MKNIKFAKLIYRVDYPTCFRLISQTGEILDKLSKDKFWNIVGEDAANRKIVVANESDDQKSTLIIDPTSISGIHESNKVDMKTLSNIWSSVNAVVSQLNIENFSRLGIRFYFLYPVNEFDDALLPMGRLIDSVAIKTLGEDRLKDCGLSLVFDNDGLFTRFTMGPMKKEEFKKYFDLYKQISIENGIFYDVDYYTTKYEFKSFKFDIFAETAYNYIKDKVEKLNVRLMPQENLI